MDSESDISHEVESDADHEAEIDAYIERNRDALNESIRISREEFARGIYSKKTTKDIIAEGRARHFKSRNQISRPE